MVLLTLGGQGRLWWGHSPANLVALPFTAVASPIWVPWEIPVVYVAASLWVPASSWGQLSSVLLGLGDGACSWDSRHSEGPLLLGASGFLDGPN